MRDATKYPLRGDRLRWISKPIALLEDLPDQQQPGVVMGTDREADVRDEMRAVLAKLKVLECALLEVLQGFDKDKAATIAAGLRARVNEWSLLAGSEFTPLVDEMASQQLTSLLGALDEAPALPVMVDDEWPAMTATANSAR